MARSSATAAARCRRLRAEITRELRDAADEPNRGIAKSHRPFAVPGVLGAHGFTHVGTDSSGHNIIFADGAFVYWVGVVWSNQVKDPPTRAQLIAAATTLYKRTQGRPAP